MGKFLVAEGESTPLEPGLVCELSKLKTGNLLFRQELPRVLERIIRNRNALKLPHF